MAGPAGQEAEGREGEGEARGWPRGQIRVDPRMGDRNPGWVGRKQRPEFGPGLPAPGVGVRCTSSALGFVRPSFAFHPRPHQLVRNDSPPSASACPADPAEALQSLPPARHADGHPPSVHRRPLGPPQSARTCSASVSLLFKVCDDDLRRRPDQIGQSGQDELGRPRPFSRELAFQLARRLTVDGRSARPSLPPTPLPARPSKPLTDPSCSRKSPVWPTTTSAIPAEPSCPATDRRLSLNGGSAQPQQQPRRRNKPPQQPPPPPASAPPSTTLLCEPYAWISSPSVYACTSLSFSRRFAHPLDLKLGG